MRSLIETYIFACEELAGAERMVNSAKCKKDNAEIAICKAALPKKVEIGECYILTYDDQRFLQIKIESSTWHHTDGSGKTEYSAKPVLGWRNR